MPNPINNFTAPDDYAEAFTIAGPDYARINIDVHNQAVYMQVASREQGVIIWSSETFTPPSFRGLDRACCGVRVRAAIPAAKIPAGQKQAQVTLLALTTTDIGQGAGQ